MWPPMAMADGADTLLTLLQILMMIYGQSVQVTGSRNEKKGIFPTLADGRHDHLWRWQMADGADTLLTLL